MPLFNTTLFNTTLFNEQPAATQTRRMAGFNTGFNKGKMMLLIKLGETTAAKRRIPFDMISSSDSVSPSTGLTFTASEIKVSQNGGSLANSAGTVTEIGNGAYYYECTTSEISTAGHIVLIVNKSGSLLYKAIAQVVAFDPYDAIHLGISSLPNVAAASTGGLPIIGTSTGCINVNGAGGVNINLSQSVPVSDLTGKTTQDVGDCLSAGRAEGAGKWVFATTTLTVYGPDGIAVVRTFTLNDPINPTQRS